MCSFSQFKVSLIYICILLELLTWHTVDLVYALYAGGPTTLTELDWTDFGELSRAELAEITTAVALLFLGSRSGGSDFSAVPPSPTGVPCIVSGYRFIGLRNMTRELSKELQSIKLVSRAVLGDVGNDVVLY